MMLVPAKKGGLMSYQVPVLTPTNYPVWAVKVKSIMDGYGIWETVEPRGWGEELDPKKKKQAITFLFQTIPKDMVLQMASYKDPKQVWDGVKIRYLGVDRVRAARRATLKRNVTTLNFQKLTFKYNSAKNRSQVIQYTILGKTTLTTENRWI